MDLPSNADAFRWTSSPTVVGSHVLAGLGLCSHSRHMKTALNREAQDSPRSAYSINTGSRVKHYVQVRSSGSMCNIRRAVISLRAQPAPSVIFPSLRSNAQQGLLGVQHTKNTLSHSCLPTRSAFKFTGTTWSLVSKGVVNGVRWVLRLQ